MDVEVKKALEESKKIVSYPIRLNDLVNWISLYKSLYFEVETFLKKLCNQCELYEKMNLPYDCITYPSYCIRKPLYLSFIEIYENLQKQLIEIQN